MKAGLGKEIKVEPNEAFKKMIISASEKDIVNYSLGFSMYKAGQVSRKFSTLNNHFYSFVSLSQMAELTF